MREMFYDEFKVFFREQLLKTRQNLELTQAQMAERLEMSERAYAELESGRSCCGLQTFFLFLIFCSENPHGFSAEANNIFQQLLISQAS